MSKKYSFITVPVSHTFHKEVRLEAARHNQTMAGFTRWLLEKEIKKNKEANSQGQITGLQPVKQKK